MAASHYFDFHFHPVFKQFICDFETNYPSSRAADTLLAPIDLKNPLIDFLEEEFLHILESQSCFSQLKMGQVTLGVANIAPIERLFAQKEGLFGFILNSRFFTSPVDQTYMEKIRAGQISYYQLFIRELNLYQTLAKTGTIALLSRKNPAPLATDRPYLALALEGAHSLCRTRIGQPGKPDTIQVSARNPIVDDFKAHPALDPAQSLQHLQQALWDSGLDLMSLVITHLSHIPEQLIATHAFGIKMLKDEAAYPIGDGITPTGKRLIDQAYTLQVNAGTEAKPSLKAAPVLIDIKHMSLKSRLDFYEYRRSKNYQLPIIASHMGVTGYSIDEWKAALNKATMIRLKISNAPVVRVETERKVAGEWGKINKTFTYNPWTINLMDEDIEEVLNSNGLIGISLDVRILGWQNALGKGEKEEYVSAEEFRFLFPDLSRRLAAEKTDPAESFLIPTKEERHPLAMCFNILHIVSTGLIRTDKDPWQHISIGSDFDGLINPLINCRDASKTSALEAALIRWLPVAEEAYRNENGGGPLLPTDTTLKALVRHILYENGRKFIEKWLAGAL
ncbi:hypothetical protein GCM10027347_34230 [Larkinella harenae]